MLMVARIVSGFGSANIAAAQAYIADITPPQERAKRMGIIGAAFGLGFVFGPFIGGELYSMGELAGGQGLYYIGVFTAVLCAVNFILAWILLPESLVDKVSEYRKVSETFKGMVTVWRIDVIGELFLVSFIYTAAFSMMQTNASVLWDEKYHLKPNEIGYVFAMIGVFSAVVQGGLIGVFQKKLGIKKMLIWGCPMAAIGLTLIPLPPDATWFYPVQVIAVMFLAFANGLLMPSINSLVSLNAPPDAQGKILGLLQSMGSLARAIGPLISGFLYDYYSSLPYFGGGVLMMIAFVLALALSKSIKFDIRN
jgi:MFS family permease